MDHHPCNLLALGACLMAWVRAWGLSALIFQMFQEK